MELDNFLKSLTGDLAPLYDLASRLGVGDIAVADDGVALSHRPNVAPESYAMRLYVPQPPAAVIRYQEIHAVRLAPRYLRILEKINGAHVFEFSLFGIPTSMAISPPLLNRSAGQPYDVNTANQFWKREYSVPAEWFHFGGGPYSHDEHVGYFFAEDGIICCCRKSGEVLGCWSSFKDFVSDEICRAEALYPEYEESMIQSLLRSNSKPRRKRWLWQ